MNTTAIASNLSLASLAFFGHTKCGRTVHRTAVAQFASSTHTIDPHKKDVYDMGEL